jgi:D-proline reductase (dithiol) PrdB
MTLKPLPSAGAPDTQDPPVRYMERTRDWYRALGYDNPYVWARYPEVPFTPLRRPLAQARIGLVTTAAPYRPDKGPQGPGAPYNAAAKFFEVYSGETSVDHDLRIAHVTIDRKHASMSDSRCWFPLPALRQAARLGQIGALAPRFHGLPTDRSQRRTNEELAPEILSRCQEDQVDAVVLVPNCPVCHQSVSLVARHLEGHGIATVVIGSARDIVEHCGVPRLLFNDFPLGNAAGRPNDVASQDLTIRLALQLLETAAAARTTLQSPLRWSEDAAWKLDYLNAERLTDADRLRLRSDNESARGVARNQRRPASGR